MKNLKYYLIISCLCMYNFGCEPKNTEQPKTGKLEIGINHFFDNKPFVVGPAWLPIASQDSIRIEKLAYYISNLVLKGGHGTPDYKVVDSYHFIRLTADNKASFTLSKVPEGHYQGISFYLGIDSLANSSLDHIGKGDLDINNGMAWDWATGYKFVLLEGGYKNAGSSGPLVLHLGSSKLFIKNDFLFGSHVVLKTNETQKLAFKAQIAHIFNQPTVLTMPEWARVMNDQAKIELIRPNLKFLELE